ncbi:MAG: hypothetical protein H8E27_03305 [Verrucomicrobia subdivision 3 bacterium]|nr:hypothetical protein [Limisphaerales bacterium]
MSLVRLMIALLLLSSPPVEGAVYRITGINPPAGNGTTSQFAAGSTIDGRRVSGQFASNVQVRAFTRLSAARRTEESKHFIQALLHRLNELEARLESEGQ